jgi:hypothetical protein
LTAADFAHKVKRHFQEVGEADPFPHLMGRAYLEEGRRDLAAMEHRRCHSGMNPARNGRPRAHPCALFPRELASMLDASPRRRAPNLTTAADSSNVGPVFSGSLAPEPL